MRKKWFISVCILFYSSIAFSQTLSVEEMHEDVIYYFTTLKNENCDLYAKYSLLQFDSIQKDILAHINIDMSILDFNRILLTLNQYTDGHTGIDREKLYWERKDLNCIMPFSIQNDSAFIDDNSLVVKINGKEINGLVAEIRKSCSWEDNRKAVEEDIKRYMPFYLSAFYNIYPPYCIESRNIITNELYSDSLNLKRIKIFDKPYGLETYEKDSIAIFYYTTCKLHFVRNEFEKMLPIIFSHLEKLNIKYLFINIAQNGGGSDEFNELIFRYLNSEEYKGYSFCKLNKSKIPVIWERELSKLNSVKRFLATKLNASNMENSLKTGVLYNKMKFKGNKKGFNGLVFLIQSSCTYSAAVDFSTQFKLRNMGIVVGEECGEPVVFSANWFNSVLPNSKIRFKYSTSKSWYEPNVITTNGFLQPDIKYDLGGRRVLLLNDYKEIIERSRSFFHNMNVIQYDK
ncbi:hypothetical protein DWX23_04595 [Parabacteroides sp. AF18-52]|mgnify:FL=1|jgi:hypothetical protein|uniref:S41 family peptidase n=1 Tax=Parabacteroides sp. AF18-52 TaxID=2292242 RepID=UPI000EFEF3C7|nr:S41 family peptidase [Parabacteroides sp. AF18-52]RHR41838.1 hypothetical protein DWX23_04595 [Parabacteroides sp. AF18-52]